MQYISSDYRRKDNPSQIVLIVATKLPSIWFICAAFLAPSDPGVSIATVALTRRSEKPKLLPSPTAVNILPYIRGLFSILI